MVTGIIQARRASRERKPDLLQLLLDARDPDTGEEMDERQLRDEVMTIFLAGHETSASALTWSWYLLAGSPMVDRKLRHEIAQAIGDRKPTIDDLARLAYPRQVFEETLRLYPPVHTIPREAVADTALGGWPPPRRGPRGG